MGQEAVKDGKERNRLPDGEFPREPESPRGSSFGLALGLVVSGLGHLAVIALLLLVPAHLPELSSETAYTVELVNPGALGTSLGGGDKPGEAGGAVQARPAPQKAPPPPEAQTPPKDRPEVLPERKETQKPKPEAKPEAVAEAEPKLKKPEPKPAEKKPEEIALAEKPKPKPSPVKPKPTAEAKPKPVASPKAPAPQPTPAKAAPRPTQVANASAPSLPQPRPSAPAKTEGAATSTLDRELAAAVERVGRRGGSGAPGSGGGGQGPLSVGPGSGPGGGGLIRGIEFLVYYNAMRSRIRDSWAWVGTNQRLKATVRFGIEADGTIVNVRLVKSSGDASYDESVLRAIARVGKLDPPPAEYRRDFADVELEFTPGDLGGRG